MPRLIAIIVLLLPAVAPAAEVPAAIIRLPESVRTVYIAETSASALHRFERDGESVRAAGRDYISIGKGGVDKRLAGDQRTPLGIYFVIEQLDTARLHEKYGATAFPLDYPNAWDRRQGRTGDGIWVHGVDRDGGVRPPLDTDGCIALPNDRLEALQGSFVANVTPVLVGRDLRLVDSSVVSADRAALEAAVGRWAGALQQGDMVAWLEMYDASFERWGMDRDEWVAFTLQTFALRDIEAVVISELLLLRDPVEEDLFLSRFRLEVRETGGHSVTTMHRLYWRRAEDGTLRIEVEDSG